MDILVGELEPAAGRVSRVERSFDPDIGHPPSEAQGDQALPNDLILNHEDLKMVSCVDATRRDTLQVRDWWHDKEGSGQLAQTMDIVEGVGKRESAFGFFDSATIGDRQLGVMGVVQEMFYDSVKTADLDDARRQLREFVLGYFMRVSHGEEPRMVADDRLLPIWLKPLSWVPEPFDIRVGFGYEQLVARRRDDGRFVKFDTNERGAIVDLRTIGSIYDWLTVRVNLFDFKLTMAPFGPNALRFQMPLDQVSYLLVTPELIIDREDPSPDVLAEYGFGYGLLPYSTEKTVFAYGPGKFAAGFQSFTFQLLKTGEIRARSVFVVNRPDKILSIDVDPVDWGFKLLDSMTFNLGSVVMAPIKKVALRLPLRVADLDPLSLYISLVNLASGGIAGRQLGISKLQLEKHMLHRHFIQHREMLITSQFIWRMVRDWTEPHALFERCHRGLIAL
jgi:hypothetical protein